LPVLKLNALVPRPPGLLVAVLVLPKPEKRPVPVLFCVLVLPNKLPPVFPVPNAGLLAVVLPNKEEPVLVLLVLPNPPNSELPPVLAAGLEFPNNPPLEAVEVEVPNPVDLLPNNPPLVLLFPNRPPEVLLVVLFVFPNSPPPVFELPVLPNKLVPAGLAAEEFPNSEVEFDWLLLPNEKPVLEVAVDPNAGLAAEEPNKLPDWLFVLELPNKPPPDWLVVPNADCLLPKRPPELLVFWLLLANENPVLPVLLPNADVLPVPPFLLACLSSQ